MEDLNNKISEILNDPTAMEKLKGLAGMFSGGQANAKPPPVENNSFSNITDSLTGGNQSEMLSTAMKLMPLMNKCNRDDDTTRLLYSLRPLLSHDRQKKLDEAIKLLRVMKIIPLIREFNLE